MTTSLNKQFFLQLLTVFKQIFVTICFHSNSLTEYKTIDPKKCVTSFELNNASKSVSIQ